MIQVYSQITRMLQVLINEEGIYPSFINQMFPLLSPSYMDMLANHIPI